MHPISPSPIIYQKVEDFKHFDLLYTGPSLEKGPLPAFFYFALSGEDSLALDPFNQVVANLNKLPIRIFSCDLPCHAPHEDKTQGIYQWAKNLKRDPQFIHHFVKGLSSAIDFLTAHHYLKKGKIAAGGLSRGGFIATHLASQDPRVSHLLAFSPLTHLSYQPAFKDIQNTELIHNLNLLSISNRLFHTQIKFFISNRDTRVGTQHCLNFIQATSNYFFSHKIRSPKIELHVYPPTGNKGHGTPPYIFEQGAKWLASHLIPHKYTG